MVGGTFLVTIRLGIRNIRDAIQNLGDASDEALIRGMPDVSAPISIQYKNLFEMPVLFYLWVAVVYSRGFDVWDLRLAWTFVVFRVIHGSIRWFVPKRVPPRLTFFALSVVTLLALWLRLGVNIIRAVDGL
jgi:hypothetical protein